MSGFRGDNEVLSARVGNQALAGPDRTAAFSPRNLDSTTVLTWMGAESPRNASTHPASTPQQGLSPVLIRVIRAEGPAREEDGLGAMVKVRGNRRENWWQRSTIGGGLQTWLENNQANQPKVA